ncbi:MAG: exodeoxyribonuclease VII large subunit [Bdellovibrionales bacterium]|nr:exodeoxyribonuclease VII large subunit [Bdellovibrionales bacterium]
MQSEEDILTVSQISYQIRNSLESQFSYVWIKGEISNFISHSSGHWYFSLKDEEAQIRAVMFKGQNKELSFKPEVGEELLVKGRVSVYPPRGQYQILCQDMERLGDGLLQKKFEEIKMRLKKEGLFDESRKKKLPLFPRHVVLITSEKGAAVRDIIRILKRRFKSIKITLVPSLVQGEQAPSNLLKALSESKKIPGADVLIIGRGGGSREDLWAFNDENLCRAIAHHPIPVISAVGHEIDFTICDFVADLRAETPSAAAELVVKSKEDLIDKLDQYQKQLEGILKLEFSFIFDKLDQYQRQLSQSMIFLLEVFKDKLNALDKTLKHPYRSIQDFQQKLDESHSKLSQSMQKLFENLKNNIHHFEKVILALDHQKIMKRGFSIVTRANGTLILSGKELNLEEILNIEFFEGQATVKVIEKKRKE